MPIIKSAVKRMRQTAIRYSRNVRMKRNMRSAIKTFSAKPSNEAVAKAQSEIDKAVKKGLLKKNTAARKKAQIAKQAKAANVKPAAKKKTTPAKKPATKTAPKPTAKKPAAKTATAAKKSPAKKTTKKAEK